MKKDVILKIMIVIIVGLIIGILLYIFKPDNKMEVIPSINIELDSLEIVENNSALLKVKVINKTNDNVIWTSSDNTIITVNEKGIVNAKKVGNAIVTARYIHSDQRQYTDICQIKVIEDQKKVLVEDISFQNETLVISKNKEFLIEPLILPADSWYESISYTSLNENIVSIDNNGNLNSLKEGRAIIEVLVDNKHKAELEIYVINDEINPEYVLLPKKVSLTEEGINMDIGDTKTLSYNLDNNSDKKYLKWSSSDTNVAKVNNGVVEAVNEGIAVITLESLNGACDNLVVTVNKKEVNVIGIVFDNNIKTELKVGETVNLTYKIFPEDATNKKVNFTSSNINILTVDEKGLVTAKSKGVATITATSEDGGKQQFITFNVTSSSSSSGGGSGSSSNFCSDGLEKGTRPNDATMCYSNLSFSLNGKTIARDSTITMKKGETITVRVNLPGHCGTPTLITRTSAHGQDNVSEYVSQYSSPSAQRGNCGTAFRASSYNWIITAKKTGTVAVSQTSEFQTTLHSWVKSMNRFNIRITN